MADPLSNPTFVLSSAGLVTRLVPGNLKSDDFPRIEFYEDKVLIWRADVDEARPNRIELGLRDIGHVQFLAPGRVTVGYGISRPWRKLHTDVKVSRLVAEDRFDQVVAHLETHAPDHLFSTFDRSELRHSRPWKLSDVLPWTNPVSHASGRVVDKQPVRLEYDTGHHRWSVRHDYGFVLLSADQEPVLQVLRSQFFEANGVVLGAMPQFASYAFGVDTGSGEAVILHEALRSIFVDGERIGSFRGLGGSQEIEFDTPVPEALALLLMLAQTQRQLLPGAEPSLVDEPDEPVFSVATAGVLRHWRFIIGLIWMCTVVAVFWFDLLSIGTAFSTLLPVLIPLIFMFEAQRKRVTERVQVLRDRLIIWRNLQNVGSRLLLTPFDVGHLSFERHGVMRVWFAVPDIDDKSFVPLHLGNRRARERDALMEHLAATSELQVCSHEDESGRVKYSRSWKLEELFPWQQAVTEARLHPDRGEGTRAETPNGDFPVTCRDGYTLYLTGTSHNVPLVVVRRERVYLHNGMVLGFVRGGLRMRLGSGENITIDPHNGELRLDEKPFGRLSNEGYALKIELVEPRSELLPLMILLAFAEGTRSTVI